MSNVSAATTREKLPIMSATPYDDAFKTLSYDCPKLLLPLLNEIFGTNYGPEAVIQREGEDHFLTKDAEQQKRQTDNLFSVTDSNGTMSYMIECESTTGKEIFLRFVSYTLAVTAEKSYTDEQGVHLPIPQIAVLYLRSNENTPHSMPIHLHLPGGSVSTFDIPAMHMADYDAEAIIAKKLYFLIPFYLFNSESRFAILETDTIARNALNKTLRKLVHEARLQENDGFMNSIFFHRLLGMGQKVAEHLAGKYTNVQKEVTKIMGGNIIDYPGRTALYDALRRGYDSGYDSGYDNGIAAERANTEREAENARKAMARADALAQEVTALKAQLATMKA